MKTTQDDLVKKGFTFICETKSGLELWEDDHQSIYYDPKERVIAFQCLKSLEDDNEEET